MSSYADRPWLARYRDDYPTDIEAEYPNALAMFAAALDRAPETEIVRYFDGTLTLAQLDGSPTNSPWRWSTADSPAVTGWPRTCRMCRKC